MELRCIKRVASLAKLAETGINIPGNGAVESDDFLIGIEPQRIGSTSARVDPATNAAWIVAQAGQLDINLHIVVGPIAVAGVDLGMAAAIVLDSAVHDRPVLRQAKRRIGPTLQRPG